MPGIKDAITQEILTIAQTAVQNMFNLYAQQNQTLGQGMGTIIALGTVGDTTAGQNSYAPVDNNNASLTPATSGYIVTVQLADGTITTAALVGGNYIGIGSIVMVSNGLAISTNG